MTGRADDEPGGGDHHARSGGADILHGSLWHLWFTDNIENVTPEEFLMYVAAVRAYGFDLNISSSGIAYHDYRISTNFGVEPI